MSWFGIYCLIASGLGSLAYALMLYRALRVGNGGTWWAWRVFLGCGLLQRVMQADAIIDRPALTLGPSWSLFMAVTASLAGAVALWFMARRMSH